MTKLDWEKANRRRGGSKGGGNWKVQGSKAPVYLRIKFATTCRACGEHMPKGTRGKRYKKGFAHHYPCTPALLERATSTKGERKENSRRELRAEAATEQNGLCGVCRAPLSNYRIKKNKRGVIVHHLPGCPKKRHNQTHS